MENVVVNRLRTEETGPEARKLRVMRVLARLHQCDAETLFSGIDADEDEIRDTLIEMVASHDVEVCSEGLGKRFALTPKGWGRYMNALGSIYELAE